MPPHPLVGRGALQAQDQTRAGWPPRASDPEESATPQALSGGGPGAGFLADTRRCDRGWICGKLQIPEELSDHLAVRESGDDP